MSSQAMPSKIIYTDGACRGNPGPGGWAWVVPETGEYASGGEPDTTNNRMEMTAVIKALKAFADSKELVICSDSKYIVDCINKAWWKNWIKRGWKTADKKPVKNQDLWEEMLGLISARTDMPQSETGKGEAKKEVRFEWVKGHSEDEGNKEADRLAVEAAKAF